MDVKDLENGEGWRRYNSELFKNQWDINEIPPELLIEIQVLVMYNVQSRNKEDQFYQTGSYVK